MEYSELFQRLALYRENIARTTTFEKGEVAALKRELRESYARRLSELQSNPFDALLGIQSLRKQYAEKYNRPPSTPAISAAFVAQGAMNDREDIYKKLVAQDPQNPDYELVGRKVVEFDATAGISCVAAAIQLAEGAILKGTDGIAQEAGDIYRKAALFAPPVSAEADVYQKMSSKAKNYARLLSKDPTGFTLMDYVAERYSGKKEPIPSFIIKDVLAIGAQFAANQYKIIYPLAK